MVTKLEAIAEIAKIFPGLSIESVEQMEPSLENKSLQVATHSSVASGEKWNNAIERAKLSYQVRKQIIKDILVEGVDYGSVKGFATDKPALFKSGGEKIVDALNCYIEFDGITIIEDFDKELFHYRYRAVMRSRVSGEIISTGIGSCNSRETKYAYRGGNGSVCPNGHKCYPSKFDKEKFFCPTCKDEGIKPCEHPKSNVKRGERVKNERICDEINTIDKMAQKRSMVAAVLFAGFSQDFTQDIEDLIGDIVDAEIIADPPKAPEPETVVVGSEYVKNEKMIEVPPEKKAAKPPAAKKEEPAKKVEPEVDEIAGLFEEEESSNKQDDRKVTKDDLGRIKEAREKNGVEKTFIDSWVKKNFGVAVPDMTVSQLEKLIERMNQAIDDDLYGKICNIMAKEYKGVSKQEAISKEIAASREKYGVGFASLDPDDLKDFLRGIRQRAA